MRTLQAQAAALAGMFAAALGGEPRTTITEIGDVRIEADLPAGMTAAMRAAVLTALGMADRYGHVRTEGVDTVWAELDREARQ
ncbi:hypothetical protein [Streptomyces sp. NPDC057582]|uniref:hypothetical protein n=1 Tax=unclassified Streptomyces TaxID=2593676 RepID=UPI0036CFA150